MVVTPPACDEESELGPATTSSFLPRPRGASLTDTVTSRFCAGGGGYMGRCQ